MPLRAYLLTQGAIALACFLAGRLTVFVTKLGLEGSPIWFPAGIALGALLLGSTHAWVGVSLGSFLLVLSLGTTWLVAVIAAIGITLSAIVGKVLLRSVGWSPALSSLRDALQFLALAVVVSPMLNATISSLNMCLAGLSPWQRFSQHWWAIELADSIGILVMTPLLLVWFSHALPRGAPLGASLSALWRRSQQHRWRTLEALLWIVLLLSLSWFVFCASVQAGEARYPSETLPLALIVWAALRFGQRGTVLSGFIVSSFAFWGLTQHRGPFLMNAGSQTQQAILLLQTFVGVTMGIVLMLAATIAERRQAENQLRFAAERERLLAETAQRIRRSLELDEILNTTVSEVRQLLQADRVFIMRLDVSGDRLAEHSLMVAESVSPHWTSVKSWLADQRVAQEIEALFKQEMDKTCTVKAVRAIDDTDRAEKPPLVAECYRYCQVKASIGVPIMVHHKMFGILLVNQCSGSRHWLPLEINLLEQLATQVEIAIQQGQLYQHLQSLAVNLEGQVQERTAELQQRMQELQSLNQVKDLLLHAVAHDLRTPVQGMLMVLNSLRSRYRDCATVPVPCAKFDRIIQSCDHQLNLLNSLLEGHTDAKPATALQCQPVRLQPVVDVALSNLKPLFLENHVTFCAQVPVDLPPIKADSQQLRQVFESFLLNAVKHNPPGLTITLSATIDTSTAATPPLLHCTIADNGRGMNQDQCDRLFQLYVRGIDNQHLTGIGLGLHGCRQVITAHGGQVGVDSHPGKGSQFWFTLPLADKDVTA